MALTSFPAKLDAQLLFEVFNTSPYGIALENLEGQVLLANASLCSMLGLTEEELRRKHCHEFSPPEDAQKDWVLFQKLRTGTIDHYEIEKRYYRSDGSLMWGRLYVNLLATRPSSIVIARVQDITDRKEADVKLQESENRFRLVANTAPVMIWKSGVDAKCDYFNNPWLEFTGRSLEAELGDGWSEGVHPADLESCLDTYRKAFTAREAFEMQYRLRRHDGQYRWVLDRGTPRRTANGSFEGYIGSCIDVTELKDVNDALTSLTGQLITAQEDECKRIAREIHDDYQQRLSLLALDLDLLRLNVETKNPEVGQTLLKVWNEVSELAIDLHSLSHRLHSSTLNAIGLVAGISAFCDEFEEQQGLHVEFNAENMPDTVPPHIALCLFRVTQEALRNVKRHSGADTAKVWLRYDQKRLHLSVSDNGKGFDPKAKYCDSGIGIRSMEERLRFVSGQLIIRSNLLEGSTVEAWVPFKVA